MKEALDELQALLSGAVAQTPQFPANSRYADLPTTTWVDAAGREIRYLERRMVPPPESFATLAAHTVKQGDRPDLIAAKELADPEAYWRLCDANGVMQPEDLTSTIGARIRIGAAAGLPGEGND
jgi:hypothetical protein